jgi:hypothetical protein
MRYRQKTDFSLGARVQVFLRNTSQGTLAIPATTDVRVRGRTPDELLITAQAVSCAWQPSAQMDLGFLECRSAEMVRKEWLAGLIAYNLIRWTMGAAAALAAVPLQHLSFSRARELPFGWCLRTALGRGSIRAWCRLLKRIAKARLPKRRKRRPSEPRAIRAFQKDVAKLEGSREKARKTNSPNPVPNPSGIGHSCPPCARTQHRSGQECPRSEKRELPRRRGQPTF